jgi:uncharacterized protein (DUF1015 family)
MVDFRPFHGTLPRLGSDESITERISPPYDIISEEERARLQGMMYNITRITLGGLNGRYEDAARLLDGWISSGKLERDGKECYYLYRQSFQVNEGWRSRIGIIGILRTESYDDGNVIPHEETFSNVKEDRLNLLRATATHCESIFGLIDRSDIDLEEVCKQAEGLFDVTDDMGTVHQILRVSEPATVAALKNMFSSKKMLIADGHHRYETAYRYSQENPGDEMKAYVLCTMVSSQDSGMFVHPTHRLVKGLDYRPDDLLNRMRERFTVREVRDAEQMEEMLMEASNPTFGLMLKDGSMHVAEYTAPQDDILWSVDAYICQEVIFNEVLQSMSAGGSLTVEHDHEISTAARRMADGELDLAVIIRAPSLELVWKVAESGRKMPKKTTYFWPKVWSGFVLYQMGR